MTLRLANIIVDCAKSTTSLAAAREFWSQALQVPVADPDEGKNGRYAVLSMNPCMEVQMVDGDSGVHLDLSTLDIEGEVARLERLGARLAYRHPGGWVVMTAPTGQKFCVILEEGT